MTSTKIESTEDQAAKLRESWDETKGFGMVMTRVLDHVDMSMKAAMAYVSLTTFVERTEGHKDQGKCHVYRETAAARAKMSETTFDRAIKELESIGLVTVQRRKHANGGYRSSVYRVFDQAGEYQGIVPVHEGVGSDCSHPPVNLTPPSPQIEATLPSDRGQGGVRLTPLEQTTTQTTRQTTGSDHSGTPTLAKASAGTSTESTREGRTAVLAGKDKAREEHTRSLAGTDFDPEPTWALFLDAFTARTEAEGTGWTVRDWVATKMRTTISRALEGYDRYRVDAAVVECARQARQPYLDSTLEGWLTKTLLGEATPQEREARFGTSAVDKAPDVGSADLRCLDISSTDVENSPVEPTVDIPEQRQATMDAKPRTEVVEPVEDDVDEDDIFVNRPEGLDDIEDQDDEDDHETEEDEGSHRMLNFETTEDRPFTLGTDDLLKSVMAFMPDFVEGETREEFEARRAAKGRRKVAA